MIPVKAYAALGANQPLEPYQFERRSPGPKDIVIDVLFCGICHSDVHQVKDEWGGSMFPMVPGHEIVGKVLRVGTKVKRFKAGDNAGVGCFVDSCRKCSYCKQGLEQFCSVHTAFSYNGTEMDLKTPTYGGYSSQIVIDENYALKISAKAPLDRVAPLLCAGITTYSPMKHWNLKKGQRAGVVGLGGLGHMAVKLAKSMGAEVTVFSTSTSKEADAKKLGAKHFALSSDQAGMGKLAGQFDFIIDTVSAKHSLSAYLGLLKANGTLVLVGASPDPLEINSFALIMGRKTLGGSLIGGIEETQEMLDYCTKKKVFSDIEVIPVSKINEAYERMLKGDVRFRFVIDIKTL